MMEAPQRRIRQSTQKRIGDWCCHRNCSDRLATRTRRRTSSLAFLFVLAAVAAHDVLGFTSVHIINNSGKQHLRPSYIDGIETPASCLQLSTKDESAPLVTDPFSDSLSFISQKDEEGIDVSSLSLKAVSVGSLLLLLSQTDVPSTLIGTYTSLLIEHPLPTKSLTSGALCGVSDVIAQSRDSSRREFNYGRLIRFAGKGCLGGIIWSFWYDNIDRFLDLDNDINIYSLPALIGGKEDLVNYQWIRDHLAIVTTALSILIEQFIWCPIVFGTFDIPISTLMNGGSFSTVQKEVDSKLGGLLVSNAKVWTPANLIIYNAPVEWRPAVSNVVDIVWQSIVSDVAADCGKVEDDICEIPDTDIDECETNFSFFAEKSRL